MQNLIPVRTSFLFKFENTFKYFFLVFYNLITIKVIIIADNSIINQ